MAALFEDLKKRMQSGFSCVAAKAVGFKKSIKHNIELLGLKREIERLFSELGGRTFELLSQDPQAAVNADPEVLEWMEKLKELDEKFHAKMAERETPPAAE
jgi:hypothetical protein